MSCNNNYMNGYNTNYPIPYSTCGSFSGMPQMFRPGGYQVQQPLPSMPTGFPTGGTTTPLLPSQSGLPAVPLSEQPPTTVQSILYTPGFLRTQIGKKMRIEFLIGTNGTTDRSGTLVAVGASYIIIQPFESDDRMLCDIYSIKFATIFA
jgi:hypothetical protein